MKSALPMIAALLVVAMPCEASDLQQKVEIPQFSAYPAAAIYRGAAATVQLKGEAKTFRTRLKQAAKQPVNFAGEYVLTSWGCGASCIDGAVVSLKSGQVSFLPETIHAGLDGSEALRFCSNSRLLIMTGALREGGEHADHYYEFSGEEFMHLKTVPIGGRSDEQ